MKKRWQDKIYALYKGERYICDGTLREIGKQTGKGIALLRWMTYPTYNKRIRRPKANGEHRDALMLMRIDEEE